MSLKIFLSYSLLTASLLCFCIDSLAAQVAQSTTQEVEETALLLGENTGNTELGPVQIEFIDAPGIAIAEDQYGFMWFGGNSGLYHYDGQEYIHYKHDPYDSTSLSVNWVESIYVGSNGMIWIGTFGGGLNRMNPETDRFTHFTHEAGKPTSLSQDTVTVILEDSRGDLWVGTHGGLNRFDKTTETFTRYLHNPEDPTSLSNNQVRVLYEDSQGTLWIGTGSPDPSESSIDEGGLNRFNPELQTFTRYLHDPDDTTTIISNKVMSIYGDSRGTFWVGTSGDGLHSMNRQSGTFTRHRFDPKNPTMVSRPFLNGNTDIPDGCIGFGCGGVTFIQEDYQGMLWIGGFSGGLNRYNPDTGAMSHHEANNSGLMDNTVWSAHESQDGTLWVGAWGGMHKVFASVNSFPLLPAGSGFTATATTYIIPSIQEDFNQNLWISDANTGLKKIDRKKGTVQQYIYQESNPNGLLWARANEIAIGPSGTLWISYANSGFSRYNEARDLFEHFFTDLEFEDIFFNNNSILADQHDHLWVGTPGRGLYELDPESEQIVNHYTTTSSNSNRITNDLILSLHESRNGHIWVGTLNGLNLIDRGQNKPYKETDIQHFLPGNEINTIIEDSNGRIWAGSQNGLHLINQVPGQIVNYTTIHGLPSNNVASILEDDTGYLWISTYEGQSGSPVHGKITRFDPKTESFTTYSNQDGLPKMGFLWGSSLKTHDGILFLGGTEGFIFFDPTTIQDPVYSPPKIALTELRISNEQIKHKDADILNRPLYLEDSIVLTDAQNDFTLNYKALAYSNPDQIQYQYQMEPFDSDWVDALSLQSVRYSQIPSGDYQFRVRSVDSRGVYSANIASLDITVLPPWWHTWWAYGLYTLILAAGVFAVDRFQRRQLIAKERERAREKELEQAKEIEKAYEDLKAAQEQLVQQEKLASLGQLTAGIAHEIKNPLNFVNNFSDLSAELIDELIEAMKSGDMNEAEELAKDISQNLKTIHKHGTRADSIVKSMLQHSRGGDGKMESTQLNPLIKEYVNLAFHGMRAANEPINVDIDLQLGDEVGEIPLVAEDFSRVILNLTNNAFDAMREKLSENAKVKSEKSPFEGGKDGEAGQGDDSSKSYEPKLTVRTHQKNETVTIEIEDNGPGIPDEIKDKILQPFFTTKKGTAGTGLGLSITNDIIKAHGGKLNIESRPGKGTTFIISIIQQA